MHKITNHCPICKEERMVLVDKHKETCSICKQPVITTETCKNHHYLCYDCEQNLIREKIIEFCLTTKIDNPLTLTKALMCIDSIPMHGPMHHLLVPAALLTSYANACPNTLDLASALVKANTRSQSVPGGTCGNWGACGAGIGVGIYLSILKDINPLSTDTWKDVGLLTSHCLNKIADQGGPHCCKRDSFIAICEAMAYTNKELGTNYQIDTINCDFFINNKQCKNKKCPFFLRHT